MFYLILILLAGLLVSMGLNVLYAVTHAEDCDTIRGLLADQRAARKRVPS